MKRIHRITLAGLTILFSMYGSLGGAQRVDSSDVDLRVLRPAYRQAGPRVLFDAAHHNIHTAGGRYERFAALVAADGYRVEPNQRPLDEGQLRGSDVLIIASALGADRDSDPLGSARPAFTVREIDSVAAWVRQGGALLLIIDHEPTGAANAALARRFGVDLSNGWVEDPDSAHHWAGCRGCLRFTRRNQLLGEHPITAGQDSAERILGVISAVGQSLLGPAGSHALLRLSPRAVDIGPTADTIPAVGRTQGIALIVGLGRLVVLGEAAMLAGQAAPRPDSPFQRWWTQEEGIHNRQFALNIMHWLSGILPAVAGRH